jgi:LmbE family N-acetylglucosaminyl deacetylase
MLEDSLKSPDGWGTLQKILVILAHPDDPEFFCGATLARWARAGHEIHYCLLTDGDKGGNDDLTPEELGNLRQIEQRKAAAIIGARSVSFLHLEDGFLMPSIDLRREIVRLLRRDRPDIVVTCDPSLLFSNFGRITHPDHRAAGQAVLDAIFPASGNIHFFPELLKEGFQPHYPREVWVSLPLNPTIALDVTDTWDIKLSALIEHKSQISDPLAFDQRMRSRHTRDSTDEAPRFEEMFRVLKLSQ